MRILTIGEMAEWSIAAVLKTVEGHTSGGSNPSLSAIKPDFQAFIVSTPNFTPKSGKVGCFDRFLNVQADQKRTGFNIAGSTPVSLVTRLFDFLCASLSVRFSFVGRISSRNQTVLRNIPI